MSVPVVSLMSAVSSAGTFWWMDGPCVKLCLGKEERRITYQFLQALAEHRSDISTFGVESAETLCPADEFAVIDALLPISPKQRGLLGNERYRSISVMTRLTSMGTRTRGGVYV